MQRKVGVVLALTFFMFAFLSVFVSAAPSDGVTTSSSSTLVSLFKPFENFIDLNNGIGGTFLAWLIFFLLLVLIYSALTTADFPEQAGLRFILATVVSFLAIYLIQFDEILAAIQSYRALGIALIIFLPLLILTFFTFVVATKASPIGIVTQRILWIVYSVYLFFQTALLLVARYISTGDLTSNNIFGGPFMDGVFKFFYGSDYLTSEVFSQAGSPSPLILVVLLIVSIATFIIFVLNNEAAVAWANSEGRSADVLKAKDESKRAKEREKMLAEGTRS